MASGTGNGPNSEVTRITKTAEMRTPRFPSYSFPVSQKPGWPMRGTVVVASSALSCRATNVASCRILDMVERVDVCISDFESIDDVSRNAQRLRVY